MKIVLASHNQKKLKEMHALLSQYCSALELLSLSDIGFPGEIEENGATFEQNALIKASAISALGYVAVADDSGLMVDALGGAPGVYSARYSGGGDAANNQKLLRALEGVPMQQRTARFVSAIACTAPFPDMPPLIVTGECEGIILTEPAGDGGFGYDPLFYHPRYKKTFAQLTPDEKNAVSHRGIAMRAFAERFAAYFRSHLNT